MVRRLLRFLDAESEATGVSLRALLATALAIHLWVTLLAVNPWHPDEHYQILEFAWARAGLAPFEGLAWEWGARIRPTLQPFLALAWLKTLRLVGVESPFVWVTSLRIASLVLAFGTLLAVAAHAAPRLSPSGKRTLWLTAFLLWFTPLFLGRFTSENWGGMAFAAGLVLALSPGGARRDLGAGALMGLAFVFRFQMALAILPALAWVALSGHGSLAAEAPPGMRAAGRPLARAGRMAAAASAVALACSLLDVWFYGAWVFTPWRYLRVNLLDGVASSFGVGPWWSYLFWVGAWPIPPVGIALLLAVGAGAVARPRSPWSWALAGFFVGHSVLAHKEPRFLLPLLYLAPVLAAWGVEAAPRWRALRAVAWCVAVLNAGLLVLPSTPALHRSKRFDGHYLRALWALGEAHPGEEVFVLAEHGDPYRFGFLPTPSVYRHPGVRGVAHHPGSPVAAEVPADTPPDRLFISTTGDALPSVAGAEVTGPVYRAEPGWRVMARAAGREGARWVRRLEDWDEWTGSDAPRRLYSVRRRDASGESVP